MYHAGHAMTELKELAFSVQVLSKRKAGLSPTGKRDHNKNIESRILLLNGLLTVSVFN